MDDTEPSHRGRILPELSNDDLVALLRTHDCTGVLWLRTLDRVVSCGTGTLRRLLLEGGVNRKLAELGSPARIHSAELEHLREHPGELDDLVRDAVLGGVLRLRRHTIFGQGWDQDRGADLMTYVVNGCLLALLNPLRDWRRHRAATVSSVAWDETELDALVADRSPGSDPAADVQDRAALEELLADLPADLTDVARTVAAEGVTWAEACRRHGISRRAVEGHLRRYRQGRERLKEDQ